MPATATARATRILWLVSLLGLAAPLAQAVTCTSGIAPSNPDSAYSVPNPDDGTITDTRTGLMWKRCVEGLSGPGCTTGSVDSFTWAQALAQAASSSFAGYSDWRLPNLKELRSLVEECRTSPAINDSAFPGAPSPLVWSGSPQSVYLDSAVYAWYVNFGGGYAFFGNRNNGYSVRLVRGGQFFAPLVVDGQCGAANASPSLTVPAANLCAAGTPGAVASANGAHAWACQGTNGGASAQCSAPGAAALGGSGTLTLAVGGGSCAVASAAPVAAPAGVPPGVSLPYGALGFTLANCGSGGSATVTLTYSGPVDDMKYWKHLGGQWSAALPATLVGHTATFTLKDGGPFDADGQQDGSILDPGGPGVGEPLAPTPVPAVTPWGLALLAGALGLWGWRRRRA